MQVEGKIQGKIQVRTQKHYEISIGSNVFEHFGQILKPFIQTSAILIFDQNIPKEIKNKIIASLNENDVLHHVLILEKEGEAIKTLAFFEEFCQNLLENFTITRKTTLVAIGGGTVGDFVGFLAATLMRGVPFVQVPTTLLSMVDSSVGGKVALNVGKFKNAAGCFYQPKHVLIDTAFLKFLPKIQVISGYAEVLKHGLIADFEFYNYLIQNEETFVGFLQNGEINENVQSFLVEIVRKSCQIKAKIVSEDEFEEKGIREILNFGHTFGHAFESLFLGKIPHGIAVAIGMICALKYSGFETSQIEKHYEKIGLFGSIQNFCLANNLAVPSASEIVASEIVKLMAKDKKNNNGNFVEINGQILPEKIKLILLEKVGKAIVREEKTVEILAFLSK